MIAQGLGGLASDVTRIVAGFLRATVPDLMVMAGIGIGVWAAFGYSLVAGRSAAGVALIVVGIAIAKKA